MLTMTIENTERKQNNRSWRKKSDNKEKGGHLAFSRMNSRRCPPHLQQIQSRQPLHGVMTQKLTKAAGAIGQSVNILLWRSAIAGSNRSSIRHKALPYCWHFMIFHTPRKHKQQEQPCASHHSQRMNKHNCDHATRNTTKASKCSWSIMVSLSF